MFFSEQKIYKPRDTPSRKILMYFQLNFETKALPEQDQLESMAKNQRKCCHLITIFVDLNQLQFHQRVHTNQLTPLLFLKN